MTVSSRCSKEIVLDESTLLSFRWRGEIPKCVSNFIKKTPMKEVSTELNNFVSLWKANGLSFRLLRKGGT